MAYKNLQHEGGEDFLEEPLLRRKQTNKINSDIEKRKKIEASEQRDKDQSKWLSMNNPAIWNGEI